MYFNRERRQWYPPFKASLPVVIFFFLSNLYLVTAPYSPPNEGQNIYNNLPYWTHCVVAIGIFLLGGVYWVIWGKVLPKIFGYELVQEEQVDSIDGWSRNVFVKRKRGEVAETTF